MFQMLPYQVRRGQLDRGGSPEYEAPDIRIKNNLSEAYVTCDSIGFSI